MDPKIKLEEFKSKFDVKLAEYLKNKEKEYKDISPFLYEFITNLSNFTLRGGKRLRPALIYYSYKAFGGKNEDEILKLSLFIELIQSFLLIHDDIIDHADTRRNGSTIHRIYENVANGSKYAEAEHFGITMGILSGDLANQLAFEIIGNSKVENIGELIKLVSREVTGVIFGQISDILLSNEKSYEMSDILRVHILKTAKYTYEIPVIAGATLANAPLETIEKLKEYSAYAGIAFQIHDDVLGIFGNDEETGKPTLSDIREGKKTFLTLKAEEVASTRQAEILKKFLGKKDLTQEEAEEVRKVIVDTGALEYSKNKSKVYVQSAQEILDLLKLEKNEGVDFLYKIPEFSISRLN